MNVAPALELRRRQAWLRVAACLLLLGASSSIPGHRLPALVSVHDWLAHALAYAIVGVAIGRALAVSAPEAARPMLLVVLLLVCVNLACLDELYQGLRPGRTPSALDAGIDVLSGTLAGGAAIGSWRRWR